MNAYRPGFGTACACVVALVAAISEAAAQQPTSAQQNAIRNSCRNDFQAVCAGVQPGGSAALQCLQQNAAKVSPPCQQALAAVGGGAPASPAASGTGAAAAPAATAPAAAPMQQPKAQPQSGMGPMSMREELRLTRDSCGPEYRTYCQRVQPGGGRALTCLEANAQSLSPGCQRALMEMKQRMPR
ncbi:MAG: hypothetical protein ABI812_07380 [Betaproteobacteria bacterium]